MIKTLTLASAFALLTTAVTANPLSFGLETEYASTEGVSATTITLGVDASYDAFVAGVKADVGTEELTKWYIGSAVGAITVTYGEQSDLFSFGGGLNTVGGNVLANPTSADRNLNIDGLYGLGVTVGLDTGTDVQNVQVVGEIASVSVGVDYALESEEITVGASTVYAVSDVATVGGIVTYDTDLAAELNSSYAALGGVVNGFVTMDTNGFDTAGVGYDRELSADASLYVEGARDLNTDDDTIALGVSFSF